MFIKYTSHLVVLADLRLRYGKLMAYRHNVSLTAGRREFIFTCIPTKSTTGIKCNLGLKCSHKIWVLRSSF